MFVSFKAACGLLTDKPKDLMIDIDAADTEDQLAVVDYVEDIYTFYKSAEVRTSSSRSKPCQQLPFSL